MYQQVSDRVFTDRPQRPRLLKQLLVPGPNSPPESPAASAPHSPTLYFFFFLVALSCWVVLGIAEDSTGGEKRGFIIYAYMIWPPQSRVTSRYCVTSTSRTLGRSGGMERGAASSWFQRTSTSSRAPSMLPRRVQRQWTGYSGEGGLA